MHYRICQPVLFDIENHDLDTTPPSLKRVNHQIIECEYALWRLVQLSRVVTGRKRWRSRCRHSATAAATHHQPGPSLSGTKAFEVDKQSKARREAGGGNLPGCNSLPLSSPGLPSCLPLPHSALSGTGLQSMTHMPAPAPSPSSPLTPPPSSSPPPRATLA